MGSCEFSEFTFGYALTDSLVRSLGTGGAAPVFANQVTEGRVGGGYDMKLPINPVPMFFQFKIPAVLSRPSSLMPSGYQPPYYRMMLRTKRPNQHNLLMDLENLHALVYYATPIFDRVVDLDRGFLGKNVHHKCAFIRPSKIGALDDGTHHVSYKNGAAVYWVRSEPRQLQGSHDFDSLLSDMHSEVGKVRGEASGLTERTRGSAQWNDRSRGVLYGIRDWLLENRSRDIYPSGEADLTLRQLLEFDTDSPAAMARSLGYAAQVHYDLALAFAEAAA